jgi:UDP-glucose 4-epimerase
MKILVLGGCGFIGSHVVDRLLAAGQSLRVLDRAPERFRPPLAGVEYVFGDYSENTILVEALVDIDVVLHLVSATVPGTAAIDPKGDVAKNLVPTIGLLETLRTLRIPKLVYLSSGGAVYGIPELVPTPENHSLRPTSSYGIVKVAIENYIQMYGVNEGLATTIIRPSNPYGPRQGHMGIQGVVATFLNRLRERETLQVWGDGSVIRDYIYITDLADLVVSAVLSRQTGVYNAGSGTGISINEVISTLEKVTGRNADIDYRPVRAVDVPRSILDIESARLGLGWEPQTAFAEGVRLHWDWIKADAEHKSTSC